MATSTAPLGRLALAAHRGRPIPRGWALDERGRPVTNARRAVELRRLTPLGGSSELGSHKGYGLATAVELLSAVLPATSTVGHFFLALDPRRFRGDFAVAVDELLDELRATRPREGADAVRVAGDPEYAALDARRARGIPLARGVFEDVRAVARASGVPFLLGRGHE
jgi:LDH2 family malate/lactate/ureidoglycolate dehydrogenase